jgi:hypothetical protein
MIFTNPPNQHQVNEHLFILDSVHQLLQGVENNSTSRPSKVLRKVECSAEDPKKVNHKERSHINLFSYFKTQIKLFHNDKNPIYESSHRSISDEKDLSNNSLPVPLPVDKPKNVASDLLSAKFLNTLGGSKLMKSKTYSKSFEKLNKPDIASSNKQSKLKKGIQKNRLNSQMKRRNAF